MKNLKKLLAVIVTVCVLATMTVPAFAAASDAEICEALDILRGDGAGVTDTYLAKGTERYQAAILYLRLIGKEDEAIAFTGEENFDDADLIYAGGQRILAYLKANPDLGWTGVGGNKFEPTNPASAQMIYKVLLEALGYKQDVDFTWAETLDFAAEKGLSAIADVAELTNADVATALVEGLKAKVKDSDATLAEKLVADGIIDEEAAAELGLVELAPATLEVVSVSASNLRELVVTYNRAPVADEAKKAGNYKVNGNNPASVSVSDDGLTVTLLIAADKKMGNYSNDIKLEIAKAVGFEEDVTIENISVKDVTIPAALKVEATGPRNLKVTFSEPLEKFSDVNDSDVVYAFKLDNGTVALDTTVASYDGRTISLKTLADLKEGEHTLEIEKDSVLKDSAGYSVAPVTLTFTYVKDTTPLTVEVVESTETTVKIKFNKAVDPGTVLSGDVYFRHTYNTTVNQVKGNETKTVGTTPVALVVNAGDDQTFTINFGEDKPFPPGNTNLYIKYEGSHKIKDYYGNELAETVLSVTTTPDLTKPTVEGVKFVDSTKLEVTFSEVVASASADNYTLKDSAGDAITINSAAFKDGGNKVVVLDTDEMNGGSYTLTVKGVKDVSIAQNEIDEVTIAFDAEDKVAPKVNGDAKQISSKKIKVFFSEAMDPATTADKAQWRFNGIKLGDDDKVEMADNNKAVIITFKNDIADIAGGISTLTLAMVKDAAGNWMEALQTTIYVDALAPVKPSAVEVTSRSTIKLIFKNEVIVGAQASDFEVSLNGGADGSWNAVVGVATTVSDGTTEIILTLKGDQLIAENNTTAEGVAVRTTDGNETGSAKNTYDNKLKFTSSVDSLTVADKMGRSSQQLRLMMG